MPPERPHRRGRRNSDRRIAPFSVTLHDPNPIVAGLFARAAEARAAGDLLSAEAAYSEAAAAGDPEAAFRLGVIRSERGELPGSIQAYEQAAEAGMSEAANNLALLYAYKLERPDDALRFWHAAIDHGDLLAMFDFGFYLWYIGETRAAAKAFEQATEAGAARGPLELGFLLLDEEREEDALNAFERAAALGVDEAWTHVGWRRARLGHLNDAERALRWARDLGEMVSGDILTDVLEALGRNDEAEATFREVTEWAASEVSMEYRDLLPTLDGEGLYEDELAQWISAECDSRTPPEVAALLFDAPRLAEAETRLQLKSDNADAAAAETLVDLYVKTGRKPRAAALLASTHA
jgi:TPR repeat protein